jgi:hypothetical protein
MKTSNNKKAPYQRKLMENRCLQCKRKLGLDNSNFCGQVCHKRWAQAKIKEEVKSKGVWVQINDRTKVFVEDPNKIEEVKAKWAAKLKGNVTSIKIKPHINSNVLYPRKTRANRENLF